MENQVIVMMKMDGIPLRRNLVTKMTQEYLSLEREFRLLGDFIKRAAPQPIQRAAPRPPPGFPLIRASPVVPALPPISQIFNPVPQTTGRTEPLNTPPTADFSTAPHPDGAAALPGASGNVPPLDDAQGDGGQPMDLSQPKGSTVQPSAAPQGQD